MISAESFWTHSLHAAPRGESITRILAASIQAVNPFEVVNRSIEMTGDVLTIAGRSFNLSGYKHVHFLGVGKAAPGMAEALVGKLGSRLTGGLVITKQVPPGAGFPYPVIQGDHPVPGDRSLFAGEKAIELVSRLGQDDLLFCLISGGGSALMTAPLPGITLADLQVLTSGLLACGARVDEINTLRRHLDRVKGGGLVRLANGATVVSLIQSDVVGNPLEAIASGPTAPDPSTKEEAIAVIDGYRLRSKVPAAVMRALKTCPETLKPGDNLFVRVSNEIVASNLQAAQAALKQAGVEGFHPYLLRTDLQGEAREAAFELSTFLRQVSKTGDPVPRPACVVMGGETTVTLRGSGKGGRNTELALAAVSELAGFPGVMLVTLASDGEDGQTGAAGAVVTGETYRRAAGLGLNCIEYLDRNDSFSFFAPLDDLLRPGSTGTNVNDLVFLFSY